MYTLIFNPVSLDTYTIGFELTVEELGGYQCNTQFLSIDSYDNNNIVNIILGDDISFSSNIISGSIKITFISQYEDSFTETITMRYNDSNNNINKTISQQIKMDIPQLVDLTYYAKNNIPNYDTITEIPQEHLEYLNSGLHASNMYGMFCKCKRLKSIPKIDIDTSKVTDMGWMFYDCWSIQSFEFLNYLNTANVQNMNSMFRDYGGYASTNILNLSNFDTSKVTDMGYMFDGSLHLTSIDLTNWDTSKVTNMGWMFHYCSNLSDVKGTLDMRSCTNIEHMFDLCSDTAHIHLKNVPRNLDFSHYNGTEGKQYIIENYLD